MKKKFDYTKTIKTGRYSSNRKAVKIDHLLSLANKCARESIALGSDGGLDEVIAVVYLRAAYGYSPVSDLENMSKAFDIYGNY
ncbi:MULTISPECIES: hypothetical protein [Gammaproteobacteria]|uniref:hypothetical protein n=1 Tax=Gammaproteobacteria TaxID=1236 RepID=UPI002FC63177